MIHTNKAFTLYKQLISKICEPTCFQKIPKHYGKLISLQKILEVSETTREGGNLLELSDAAEAIGFKTIGVKLEFNKLKEAPLPFIEHWNKKHFAVFYKIKKMKSLFLILRIV
ncbi:cysteine peptidase family C39 domain-containing protein [Cellulophaga sp. Hel_I_12]|uniref:cysteine peptidase family C39 domain-containing protein n=1 Tax=Cellulophaga sp. Hel_I_12 TaxID=1249972 RepID=UPI00068A46BC|nr:cysteine peptidase family C39 domain-containing protein [Cellulophaga sp. Hel_I_12]|tara:strand:+ start:236 stop:574 length:339 start_codon:yes stop_codon:yes gene_type:complete